MRATLPQKSVPSGNLIFKRSMQQVAAAAAAAAGARNSRRHC